MVADIEKLIEHILKQPDNAHLLEKFQIDDYSTEYSDTQFKPKEHKLWTPCKKQHRCFLMMQRDNNIFRIHHLLDNEKILNYPSMETKTFASKFNDERQFKGAVEISLSHCDNFDEKQIGKKVQEIKEVVCFITKKTVEKKLNYRQRKNKK
jgi:hypothetical protein